MRNARFGYRANGCYWTARDQPKSQPEDIYGSFSMGMTAENIAERYEISREEQDQFAFESEKAIEAMDSGRFKEEIVPVMIKTKRTVPVFRSTSFQGGHQPEKLAKLRPAFKEDGTVTAATVQDAMTAQLAR